MIAQVKVERKTVKSDNNTQEQRWETIWAGYCHFPTKIYIWKSMPKRSDLYV